MGAQEPPARRPGCDLTLEPRETTRGEGVEEAGGEYVYHVWGGMLWRCGNAEMEADSAVRFAVTRRVEMAGNIRYRDTIRSLRSDFLTYHEATDLVVATGNVLLTRLASGSTLAGPRVEFIRAVSGGEGRTVATGRPHLVLYLDTLREKPPFEVDAERVELAGERTAWAWGEVEIRRPDLAARADSALFEIDDGSGALFGTPRVEGEDFRLSGDTVRLTFEESELREVRAVGRGHAAGESYEVLGEEIVVRLGGERLEEVRARGGERSMAVSSPYRLYGDSLRFAFAAGRIDTVLALGSAVAVEADSGRAGGGEAGEAAVAAGGALPPAGAPGEPSPIAGVEPPAPTADTVGVSGGSDRIPPPHLSVEGETNWIAGDTLYAIFGPAASGAEEQGGQAAETGEAGEGRTPGGRESAGDEAAPARQLERLRVVGRARAFYATVRDSAATRRLSRNYLMGRAIEVILRDGRAQKVVGEDAIGVYLEPAEPPAGGEPPPPGPGTRRRGRPG